MGEKYTSASSGALVEDKSWIMRHFSAVRPQCPICNKITVINHRQRILQYSPLATTFFSFTLKKGHWVTRSCSSIFLHSLTMARVSHPKGPSRPWWTSNRAGFPFHRFPSRFKISHMDPDKNQLLATLDWIVQFYLYSSVPSNFCYTWGDPYNIRVTSEQKRGERNKTALRSDEKVANIWDNLKNWTTNFQTKLSTEIEKTLLF